MANIALDSFRPLDASERGTPPAPVTAKDTDFTLVAPVPGNAPEPNFRWRGGRLPAAVWTYFDESGGPLFHTARFDNPEGTKDVLPLTLWRSRSGQLVWRWKAMPGPRPLYGLNRLASDKDAAVLVVEGEKCADAAHSAFPSYIVVTSPGGAGAAHRAHWGPLAGRRVLIWPDADEAGLGFAQMVAKRAAEVGALEIHIIDSMTLAETGPCGKARESKRGYDVVDALGEGWAPSDLQARFLQLASLWTGVDPDMADRQDHDGIDVPLAAITSDPKLATDLRKLAQLPPGDYQKCRKTEAKRLGLTLGALDAFVQTIQGSSGEASARAQRDHLLELAAEAELWRDPSGEAFATVVEDGVRKSFRVRSGDFRNWLIRCWMRRCGGGTGLISTPGGQSLQDATSAVEAKAQQGAEHPIFIRIGHHSGEIYIDLGDDTWSAVKITNTGWQTVEDCPVRFIRPPGLRPLPRPSHQEHGLRALLSILPDDADAKDTKVLLLSFLWGAFMPQGSLPLLALAGRQGSGKSTLTRRLRSLIDPNQAPARQQPRDEVDLITAARNGALLCFDNVSRISQDLSDALCRLATGAGFSRRRLYTDTDEVIVQVRRPVIINGITDLVRMPDLADRAIFVELPTRRAFAPEADLEQGFVQDHPAMLGALYSAVAAALAGYTQETSSPGIRLADFERWARAAAPVFGIEPDDVSTALINNRTIGDRMLIDEDVVASLVLKLVEEQHHFTGTATDLLAALRDWADPGDWRGLPNGPRALSAHLRRFVPAFERIGVFLDQHRVGADRQRIWTIGRRTNHSVVEEF